MLVHLAMALSKRGGQGTGNISTDPELPTMGADDFGIVFIPDMQRVTRDGTAEFETITTWIADHAADSDKKIELVLCAGDMIFSSYGNLATQFSRADAAIDNLDVADVSYLLSAGNHDYDNDPPTDVRDVTSYTVQFPQARFTGQTGWSGGFYEANHSENAYWLKTIGANDYIFMILEFGPRQAVINWAAGILDTYSTRDAIIATHSYMYRDGTRTGVGDQWNPHDIMPGGSDCHDGDELWDELIKLKDNIRWVHSGHDGTPTSWSVANRQDNGDLGNLVNQVVSAYHYPDLGYGNLRLLLFRRTDDKVYSYTYNVMYDFWIRDSNNEYVVDYE